MEKFIFHTKKFINFSNKKTIIKIFSNKLFAPPLIENYQQHISYKTIPNPNKTQSRNNPLFSKITLNLKNSLYNNIYKKINFYQLIISFIKFSQKNKKDIKPDSALITYVQISKMIILFEISAS